MAHAIRMPKPGQMTEECVLTQWLKQEGDAVRRGDVLFEIETDKSTMEVESFEEGILLRRLVEAGATVPVNGICGYVGREGEEIPDEEPGSVALPEPPAAPPELEVSAPAVSPSAPAAASRRGSRMRISPRATRLAMSAGIDPATLTGSGPEGRITERDVRAALDARTVPAPSGQAATRASSAASLAAQPRPLTAPQPAAGVAPQRPLTTAPDDEVYELSRMRRVIAERLTGSWTSTPHFTVTVAVDMTRVFALRGDLKVRGENLSITDLVLAATAQTLVEFPEVNSRTDGVSAVRRGRVHLGLAVSLPAGLVVPVIRDADRLTVAQIHDRALDLARSAREGTLSVDDMSGGTFTVSNLGMFGVEEFSAIINPGEAAILAVSSAVPTPVALGDGIAVRPIMRLTLSADHRLVDGEMGARFLNAIRRRLEDAASLRNDTLNS